MQETGYYKSSTRDIIFRLKKVEHHNVLIDGRNFFDQLIKNEKIAIGQGDNYTNGCLLDYNYFKKHKMIAIDLRKKQALDVNPKAIQQINFTGNLSGNKNRLIFFIIEEAKETILNVLQGTVKVL